MIRRGLAEKTTPKKRVKRDKGISSVAIWWEIFRNREGQG